MAIFLKFLYKSLEFTIFKKNKHPTSICLKHWLSNIWVTFFLQEAIMKLSPHNTSYRTIPKHNLNIVRRSFILVNFRDGAYDKKLL